MSTNIDPATKGDILELWEQILETNRQVAALAETVANLTEQYANHLDLHRSRGIN